mmetsp:Transcript_4299/g.11127  ORF Transcript_4299/g.11127 Transcript_4299/m.11127 type:complete len:435 (+) Transcript_4299:548-1852(+)
MGDFEPQRIGGNRIVGRKVTEDCVDLIRGHKKHRILERRPNFSKPLEIPGGRSAITEAGGRNILVVTEPEVKANDRANTVAAQFGGNLPFEVLLETRGRGERLPEKGLMLLEIVGGPLEPTPNVLVGVLLDKLVLGKLRELMRSNLRHVVALVGGLDVTEEVVGEGRVGLHLRTLDHRRECALDGTILQFKEVLADPVGNLDLLGVNLVLEHYEEGILKHLVAPTAQLAKAGHSDDAGAGIGFPRGDGGVGDRGDLAKFKDPRHGNLGVRLVGSVGGLRQRNLTGKLGVTVAKGSGVAGHDELDSGLTKLAGDILLGGVGAETGLAQDEVDHGEELAAADGSAIQGTEGGGGEGSRGRRGGDCGRGVGRDRGGSTQRGGGGAHGEGRKGREGRDRGVVLVTRGDEEAAELGRGSDAGGDGGRGKHDEGVCEIGG